MGLDISAYSKIKQEKHGDIYIGHDKFGTRPDLSEGEYAESDDSVYHGFRAGSYSGYNQWRENLSMAIHGVMPSIIWNSPEKYAGKEFFEIINFSDCEGCFGPKFSAKLHADFVNNRDKFVSVMETRYGKASVSEFSEASYAIRIYDDFMKSFEIAKDSGVLIFS